MSQLSYLSIEQTHELLKSKKVSCVELVNYYLDRIKEHDSKIGATLFVNDKQAIEQAQQVDKKVASGQEIGLLEGIPYTTKDMFLTAGLPTTAGSKILQDYLPPYTATAIEKLNATGAILLAKVNQDEFAHGGSTENSAYHKTKNPWDVTRVPGGSSGGSAAALAADFGVFSLGTDTGGSVRQPASYCGITGFKPTYGAVSRYGVVAMASSFDCISPIARTAGDVALVLDVIAGIDKKDSTTIDLSVKIKDVDKKIRIGSTEDYKNNSIVTEFTQALKLKPTIIDLPDKDIALATYYILVPSEISSNLERYDGIRYGKSSTNASDISQVYSKTRGEFFGQETIRRNLTGTYALSAGYYDAYYKKAMQLRSIIISQFNDAFEKCDFIVLPTTLEVAFEFGSKNDPVEMYKTDLLTVLANLAGLPAISVPAGIDAATGMPQGLQIIGKQKSDYALLELASQFQAQTDWHTKVAKVRL